MGVENSSDTMLQKMAQGSMEAIHRHTKKGLSWIEYGRCCDAAYENDTYRFELDPRNQFDVNAVKIYGKQTGDMMGHIPRSHNIQVGKWLRKPAVEAESSKVASEIDTSEKVHLKGLLGGTQQILTK